MILNRRIVALLSVGVLLLSASAVATTRALARRAAPPVNAAPAGQWAAADYRGGRSAGVRQCGQSNGARLCLHVPDVTLRGTVRVDTTVSGSPHQVRYSWGPTVGSAEPLLTAFGHPWALRWPTLSYPDGTGYLVAQAYSSGQGLGSPVSVRLTIDNGRSRPAVPRDWQTRFRPRTPAPQDLWRAGDDPVIAAVGDSGDGAADSSAVASLIRRSPANMLIYLGDIYEKGTAAEWETNFGAGGWGRLVGFTQPVLGNHEAHHPEVWRTYWRGQPNWSTFAYGGVRFLLLDSECPRRGCADQYRWAQRVLAANRYSCVVAAWHRPILSPGPEAPWMAPLWRLVAEHGGDLVLNGHQHHMQAYQPLNGQLLAGRRDSHLVQLVSGAGGHILHRGRESDRRGAWQAMGVPGAVFVTAVGGKRGAATALTWSFRDTNGAVVRTPMGAGTGSVTC